MADQPQNFQIPATDDPVKTTGQKPAIRTMKSDIEEMFKTTKPSLIQIMTQEIKPPEKKTSKTFNRNYYYIIGGGAGLVGIALAVFFFLSSSREETLSFPKLIPPAPFFATETSRTISVKLGDRSQFLRLMEDSRNEREREGTMKRILLKVTDAEERFATLNDFFSFYRISTPPNFLDRISSLPMITFYYGPGGARLGIFAKTFDPDRTWAEMLRWESSLILDLSPLFFGEAVSPISSFEDRTYRNIDWRFLKLSQIKDLGIGYTIFPAGNILILTTGKEAMETVINRLFEAR